MSENRFLTDEGVIFYPVSKAHNIGHDQMKVTLDQLIYEYNISSCHPQEGGYTLLSAITKLGELLNPDQKIKGTRVLFIDSDGDNETWEYTGEYGFADERAWLQVDSSIILDLQQTTYPITVTLEASETLVPVTGNNRTITMTGSVFRRGVDVTSEATLTLDGASVESVSTVSFNSTVRSSHTYTLSATYQKMTETASVTIYSADLSYYGVLSGDSFSVSSLSGASSVLKNSKEFEWEGINLDNQRICYAYPSYFGELELIKDGNCMDITNSYTHTQVAVGSTLYEVYVLTTPVTAKGVKQIYS